MTLATLTLAGGPQGLGYLWYPIFCFAAIALPLALVLLDRHRVEWLGFVTFFGLVYAVLALDLRSAIGAWNAVMRALGCS